MATYTICADGACSGNPGPGGYAYEIWSGSSSDGNVLFGGSGSSVQTTNNIMELRAAICAIEDLIQRDMEPGLVTLRLDSEYVLKGMFEWMSGWIARGWKTAGKKPVANVEMWKELDGHINIANAWGWTFVAEWVKGHTGDIGNERVDTVAQKRRDEARQEAETGVAPHEATTEPDTAVEKFQGSRTPLPATEISAAQVDLLRSILDPYMTGDTSIKAVILTLRDNARSLGF